MARWSLLLAAFLHFGNAVVGNAWHSSSLSLLASAASQPSWETETDTPDPLHDELGCAACQSLVTLGLPTPRSAAPLDTVPALRLIPEHLRVFPSELRASIQARAPPVA